MQSWKINNISLAELKEVIIIQSSPALALSFIHPCQMWLQQPLMGHGPSGRITKARVRWPPLPAGTGQLCVLPARRQTCPPISSLPTLNPFLCDSEPDLPTEWRKAGSWPQKIKMLLQTVEVLPAWPGMLLGCGMKGAWGAVIRKAMCLWEPWNQKWHFCLPANHHSWPASPFTSGLFRSNQISYLPASKLSNLVI